MEGPDNPAPAADRPPAPARSEPGTNSGRGNNRRNNQRAQDGNPRRGGQNANGNPRAPRAQDPNGNPRLQDSNATGQSRPRGDRGDRGNRARPPRNGNGQPPPNEANPNPDASHSQNWRAQGGSDSSAPAPRRGRGSKFNTGLTTDDAASSAPNPPRARQAKPAAPVADDLTSILTAALRTPPYPDCPICFSAVHPAQPTWSCSPSLPVLDTASTEEHCCYTTFHLKCVRAWASKSVKELADAWAARGEPGRGGEWRCPGCQARRAAVPTAYRCFCGSTPSPAPPRIATPHSCAGPCARARPSCSHPCPLLCHPGPCPPCRVTTDVKCGCPQGKVLALRCGAGGGDVSCGSVCGRKLACGAHECKRDCHLDECDPCSVREDARCWCGKEEKEVGCGEGDAVPCSRDGANGKDIAETWIGCFACAETCDRFFDCGTHRCKQPCHSASGTPAQCPRSPEKVRTCPCGRRPIARGEADNDVKNAFPVRASCTAPIPTCGSPCRRILPGCGHACAANCHEGACPPCVEKVVRPCRCGGSAKTLFCHAAFAVGGDAEVLCEKPCGALRACGRHRCLRVCCPLASVAALQQQKKGKKRAAANGGANEVEVGEERGGLHECDLVCGKMLGCGTHRCEERDHKGPCPPCLRSSFEELICPCGLTVLEPPIPCGTQITCTYQCPRPPPPCGHPRTQHMCHPDETPCPPCPFLTTKRCMCGKKEVGNVRCAAERVGCGSVCGRIMACGGHRCERLCHLPGTEEDEGGEGGCGKCTAPCGKPRRLCLPLRHPCTQPCHAPASCDEVAACTAVITVSCACGRIRQPVQCGRSSTSTTASKAHSQQPKCTNECLIAKRNARLADALGISPEGGAGREKAVWPDDVIGFGRANAKFVGIVEKAFADFVAGDKKMQVLPHMPMERRKFVHDVAAVYRMDTQMVDQEPHRSVQLLRRFDTKIPSPLLSAVLAVSGPPPSLGKLADLRTGAAPSWRAGVSPKPATPPNATAGPSTPRSVWGAAGAAATTATAAAPQAQPPLPVRAPPAITVPTSHAAATPPPAQPLPLPLPISGTPVDVPEDWEDDV
ncbi:hypothetical protein C8F04DRAFT_996217 [Mycena alexandri]|uniref:R3H domain-containing protein n=1 Tax=Mycena alexandri TaxID=1745969 RepID=A0AAD6T5W9_9AGAR|nr:hypothetical protein C8F04DRAFT_996217 [Mycena alexandri]